MENNCFSVILPCYRMGRYIGEALESVGAQSCEDWEILTVDDCGPEDGTREIVEAFAAKYSGHRVQYIRHLTNQGVSAARNTGLAAARGKWAAFLDPDDYWLKNHLERAREVFETRSGTGVVSSPVEAFTETEEGVKVEFWPITQWRKDRFPASLIYNNFMQPSATIVTRALLAEAGGFDTSPEMQHIEDYDLWIRLAELGGRFVFLEDASCRYRRHATAATSDGTRMNQLHNTLTRKHLTFFVRMQSRLLSEEAEEISRISRKLDGPFTRFVLRADRLLAKLKAKL